MKKRLIVLCFVFVFISFGLFLIFNRKDSSPVYSLESRLTSINNTSVLDSDTIGWLRVQGTNIDTPIVTLTESVSDSVDGDFLWLSSYYSFDENRKVIYGHNIRNISNEPEIGNSEYIRFEDLMSFVYYGFAKDNLYIQYSDSDGESLYKIYAVSFNYTYLEYGQSYEKSKVSDYIEDAKKASIYDYDVDVDEDDDVISLITCTRYFGVSGPTQFRVDARKVRDNEKIVKYSVETNSNYEKIK